MKKQRIITYTFFLSMLLIAVGCKPKYDTTSPKITDIAEAIFASGSYEPDHAYTLTSLFDGYLLSVQTTENALVADKQVLFLLDSKQQSTQVNIAQNNMKYAAANATHNAPQLAQISAQIEAAKAKMQNDSLTLSRIEKLYTKQSVSQQDAENARVNFINSKSNYIAATENYKQTLSRLQQEWKNSTESYKNIQLSTQYSQLQAIGAGRVYQIFKKQGDLVRKGEQVALLGAANDFIIELEVDEGSIHKIDTGMLALIEFNTFKNITHTAHISKIYPHFNEATQSYKIEAKLDSPVTNIIAGTQLQANIITKTKKQVMVIPHNYMLNNQSVLVLNDKKIDTVKVTTGITSDDIIEITSGLKADAQIVKMK